MEILRQSGLTLDPLSTTFLLGFTTIVLLFWYGSRKHNYWKKLGIPYVDPLPIFGSVREFSKSPFHDVELLRYNKYGKIYGHYERYQPLLSVAEPEILRKILVKDFPVFTGRRDIFSGDNLTDKMVSMARGEDWKRLRTIVTPTFTTGKIKRMFSIFQECSETVVMNFKKASEGGKPIDAKDYYGAFTMDVIASTAFSTKIDSHNDPNNQFAEAAKSFFPKKFSWTFFFLFMFPGLFKLLRISIFPKKSMQFFTDVTLQIIEERKRTGQTRNDFLQMLLDSAKEAAKDGKLDLNEKDDIAENYGKVDSDKQLRSYYSKKTLSQDELVAQCVSFFFGGYDTAASTLSFASYLLALNPDVQEKLIKEVDDALGTNDGELTYDSIQSMKYLDNAIAETLRLYSPLVRLERMADEDYKLGDTGLTLPKGMLVTIPVYAIHRDPKIFPNPETFDPDRFTPEERAKRDIYSYMPFGAGPRNCVAMRFALMEIKVCLAHVLSNFRIKKCDTTQVPLEFYNGQGILQPKCISLFMELRKDAVKPL